MRPTGVGRDVAADRRDLLRRGIRRIKEALRGDAPRKVEIHEARFDPRAPVRKVNLDDAIHAHRRNDDAAGGWDGPAAESGAGATGDDRLAELARDLHNSADFVGRARQDDGGRSPAIRISIEGVHREVFGLGLYAVGSKRADQPLAQHAKTLQRRVVRTLTTGVSL